MLSYKKTSEIVADGIIPAKSKATLWKVDEAGVECDHVECKRPACASLQQRAMASDICRVALNPSVWLFSSLFMQLSCFLLCVFCCAYTSRVGAYKR